MKFIILSNIYSMKHESQFCNHVYRVLFIFMKHICNGRFFVSPCVQKLSFVYLLCNSLLTFRNTKSFRSIIHLLLFETFQSAIYYKYRNGLVYYWFSFSQFSQWQLEKVDPVDLTSDDGFLIQPAFCLLAQSHFLKLSASLQVIKKKWTSEMKNFIYIGCDILVKSSE